MERYVQTEAVRPTTVTPNRELLLARDVYCEWVYTHTTIVCIERQDSCDRKKTKQIRIHVFILSGGILLNSYVYRSLSFL